ncbi:DUF3999 family protein [Zavarzinella formosa]|uniref:DUF3999 family protein n=1 Tax=Zavarzinella formosa TaxID=360055 RepID=UPI0002D4D2F2|nr:DUF3999 family protein [Zavarzinella formosa]
MINRRLCILGLVLLASQTGFAAGPNAESLAGWPTYLEVSLPEKGEPGLCDLFATPAIYTQAGRADLLDLRLYDARGREVPFALRRRNPRSEFRAFAPKDFNRVKNANGSAAVSLDLGEGAEDHNRMEVTAGGSDYRRAVRVEGGDDGTTWREVAAGELRYFTGGGQVFDQRGIDYAPSRFRYMRVSVSPDKGNPADRPGEVQVRVMREIRDPGLESVWPAILSPREPVRSSEGYASQWMITLPGGEKAPWETLAFEADDKEFSRSYRLEEVTTEEPWPLISSGQWERGLGRTGPLQVRISQRTIAAKLRLVVIDQRNPPLQLRLKSAGASADQILFQRTEEMSGPLRLYLGNPSAPDPGYDIGRTLPAAPVATRTTITGEPRRNPEYRPPADPRPLIDRLPWVTSAVFGAVVVALAGLLAVTARQAIRKHDAASASQT